MRISPAAKDGRVGRLLSVEEAAEYIGVRPGTLRNWLSARRIAYVKVGRLTRLSSDTLNRIHRRTHGRLGRRSRAMKLYKRCGCDADARCVHHYWYRFWLHHREHRASTHTANRDLAHRIAIKRQGQTLESHEKLRKPKTVKLSDHATAYAEWAEKTNRSSLLKDRRVLKGFLETVGDRPLDDITAFHVERWKTLRAKEVSQSSVNRELNVIRGCFSRAVEWRRLIVSPMKSVKPYRVDNVRMRVLSPDEITHLLESCPPALQLIARTTLEAFPGSLRCSTCASRILGRTTRRSCRPRPGRAVGCR